MNLGDVAVLVEAVQAGSLSAAARRLSIAPMAASRRLAALEQELGVRLLHRTTRALALTAEGEAFLPYAQAMLEHEATARAALRPSAQEVSGLLRVTTSAAFGRKVVAPLMPAFLAVNPLLRVDVMTSDGLVDIVAEGIDVAIRIAVLRDSSMVARRLADSPRGLYAAPGYLLRHGVPQSVADLAHHECLTVTGATHWSFTSGGRTLRQKITGRFTASTFEVVHQACLSGLGICALAEWNAAPDVAAGHLVPIPLADGDIDPIAIWAVTPSARLVPPKVSAFVNALQQRLRGS